MVGIDRNPRIMEIIRIVGNVIRGKFMRMPSLVGISDSIEGDKEHVLKASELSENFFLY